jgi:hypothetical protein
MNTIITGIAMSRPQWCIKKRLRRDRDHLRKIAAHQALYVRLQQSAADTLSRGAEEVVEEGRNWLEAGQHEGGGLSENMATMREVTEKLASLTLVDNTES